MRVDQSHFNLRQLFITLSVMGLLFGSLAFGGEVDERTQNEAVKGVTFEEIAAERMQYLRDATLALDQAQARLEDMGFKDVADRSGFSYSKRPMTLQDILPFRTVELNSHLPLAILLEDAHAAKGISRQSMVTLMESLNVQLIGELEIPQWPDTAILRFTLESSDGMDQRTIEATMHFDRTMSSYYLDNAFESYQELTEAIHDLTNSEERGGGNLDKPTLRLVSLSGFKSLATELEPLYFPSGVSIVHSIRLGEVRLATGYSWLGRPQEVLSLHSPQFLL